MPLAPRTARALDLAIGERVSGPVLVGPNGQRLDRHGAGRIVRRVARRAGLDKPIGPHTLRHAFITAALDAGVPLRAVQEAASHADPHTTVRHSVPEFRWTAPHEHSGHFPSRRQPVGPLRHSGRRFSSPAPSVALGGMARDPCRIRP
ncbi:MAG TPA: tyrosine-type recombinase/integrase, partial [Acidimicrobiales bacterium]|nr:tyrosine-type recombinase/integrase [Acidimicrobiales bacterium]